MAWHRPALLACRTASKPSKSGPPGKLHLSVKREPMRGEFLADLLGFVILQLAIAVGWITATCPRLRHWDGASCGAPRRQPRNPPRDVGPEFLVLGAKALGQHRLLVGQDKG